MNKHDKIGTVYTAWDQIGDDKIRRATGYIVHGGIAAGFAALFESGATMWMQSNGGFWDRGIKLTDGGEGWFNQFTDDDWDLIAGRGKYAPEPADSEIHELMKKCGHEIVTMMTVNINTEKTTIDSVTFSNAESRCGEDAALLILRKVKKDGES